MTTVEPAKLAGDGRDGRDDLEDARSVTDVERPGSRVSANLGDLSRDRFGRGGIDVSHGDPGALLGEEPGGGSAHALPRTDDEYPLVADRPGF